jgi:methylmalonyl-CoA mutase N-terminal domain/subunit
LGGAQSLHTNGWDEALALPTEASARLALRTQQILAEESGVANTVDPVGGAAEIERRTDQLEAEARGWIGKIDRMGGAEAAIESGFFQRTISESAYRVQQRVQSGERVVVGMNRFAATGRPATAPTLQRIDPRLEAQQSERLQAFRRRRSPSAVRGALDALRSAAESGAERVNLVERIIDAARAECTLGEVSGALLEVFGRYHGPESVV